MDKKYDMLVSALDAIAFTRESDPVKLKNIAREALKGFNSRPTPRALDAGESPANLSLFPADVISPAKVTRKPPRQ